MIWHPVSLAIVMIDALALLFVLRGAITAVRVSADWAPGASTKEQIALETAAEAGGLAARTAFALIFVSTVILVISVTNVFPGIVPGAMCGTGVLQATGGAGAQAFFFKLLCLGVFYLWFVLDKLDRTAPDAPLAGLTSKMLLLATPVAILSFFATFSALTRLDAHTPVDCCAIVYDQFTGLPDIAHTTGPGDDQLLWSFGILMLILTGLGTAGLLLPRKWFGILSGTAAIFSFAWGVLSGLVLVRVLSAYTYEVLHHHCPWCLFLPEHHLTGFALFGLLGLAIIQAPAAYVSHRAARDHPGIIGEGDRLSRRALAAMVFFVLAFTAAAVWPALSWRIRFGVWMT